MRKNLYVGNLPFDITTDELREAFEQFGTVSRSQIISDRETGRSRLGCGKLATLGYE